MVLVVYGEHLLRTCVLRRCFLLQTVGPNVISFQEPLSQPLYAIVCFVWFVLYLAAAGYIPAITFKHGSKSDHAIFATFSTPGIM